MHYMNMKKGLVFKRFIAFMLATLMLMNGCIFDTGLITTEVKAEEGGAGADPITGTVDGSNITYTIKDNVLTISGNGVMPEFTYTHEDSDAGGKDEFHAPWYKYAKDITEINVGGTVENISKDAFFGFAGSGGYKNFHITSTFDSFHIDDFAFCHCNGFDRVEIPDNVTEIGWNAFTNMHMSSSVTTDGCQIKCNPGSYAEEYVRDKHGVYFYDEDGIYFTVTYYAYLNSSKVLHTDVRVKKNSMTVFPEHLDFFPYNGRWAHFASWGYNNPIAVTKDLQLVMDGNTGIVKQDFYGLCGQNDTGNGLYDSVVWNYDKDTQTLSIGGTGKMCDYSSAKEQPWYAYAKDIKHVRILEGVSYIGAYCFSNFTSLEEPIRFCDENSSCTIHPDSSTSDIYADYVAHGTITDNGANIKWYINKAYDLVIEGVGTTDIEGNLTKAQFSTIPWADYNSSIKTVSFVGNITKIGKEIFNGIEMTDIIFELTDSSKLTIEEEAFMDCNNLASLVLPVGMNALGDNAFAYCSNLKSVYIDGIKNIYGDPFIDCNGDFTLVVKNMNSITQSQVNGRHYELFTEWKHQDIKNISIVCLDDSFDLSNFYSIFDKGFINNLYTLYSVPNLTNGFVSKYTVDEQNRAIITAISVGDGATDSVFDIPEYIYKYPVYKNTAEIGDIYITHEGRSHVYQYEKCILCQRSQTIQYNSNLLNGVEKIYKFEPSETDYILYIDKTSIFEIIIDFDLSAGKTFTIPKNATLRVPADQKLAIASGATLIVEGTLEVEGELHNYGKMEGKGKIVKKGNGKCITVPQKEYLHLDKDKYSANLDGTTVEVVVEETIEIFETVFVIDYAGWETSFNIWRDDKWNPVDKPKEAGHYKCIERLKGTSVFYEIEFDIERPVGKVTLSFADFVIGDMVSDPVVTSNTNKYDTRTFYIKKKTDTDFTKVTDLGTYPYQTGDYTLRVVVAENENYQECSANCNFKVLPRPLSVVINSASINYMESIPEFTYQLSDEQSYGLIDTESQKDTLEDVGISLMVSKTGILDAGRYQITGTWTNSNYEVIFNEDAYLTVNKIRPTITVSKKEYNKTYRTDKKFSLEGISYTGQGALTYSLSKTEPSYTIDDNGDIIGTGIATNIPNGSSDFYSDAISLNSDNSVNIEAAGTMYIIVEGAESKNYLKPLPQVIKVVVAKYDQASFKAPTQYYLHTKDHEVEMDLTQFLPDDIGEYNISHVESGMHVTINPEIVYDTNYSTGFIVSQKSELDPSFNSDPKHFKFDVKQGLVDSNCMMKIGIDCESFTATEIVVPIKLIPAQKLTIDKAVETLPSYITYGDALSKISLVNGKFGCTLPSGETVIVDGKTTFDDPTYQPKAGTYKAAWTFTPAEKYYGLYEPFSGVSLITVNKAKPIIKEHPVVEAPITYDPNQTLKDVNFLNGFCYDVTGARECLGTWKWADSTIIPTVDVKTYTMKFTPTDTLNYEIITDSIKVNVTKADYIFPDSVSANSITYGDPLSQAVLPDLKGTFISYYTDSTSEVEGTLSWEDGSLKPTVADSLKTFYYATFTPKNSNYVTKSHIPIKVPVQKRLYPSSYPTVGEKNKSVLNSVKTVSEITDILKTDWQWIKEDQGKVLLPEVPIEITAEYIAKDKGNYENETFTYIITRNPCEIDDTVLYSLSGEYAPTCITGGIGHKECKLCKDVLENNIAVDALGHDYKQTNFNWDVSETNVRATKCNAIFNCNRNICTVLTEGHTVKIPCEVTHTITDATCTINGNVQYDAKCIFEGKTYPTTKNVTIPALGHQYEPVIDPNDPELGFAWNEDSSHASMLFICSRTICDVPDHAPEIVQAQMTIEDTATCTKNGIKTYFAKINFAGYQLNGIPHKVDSVKWGHRLEIREHTRFAECETPGYWKVWCRNKGCTYHELWYPDEEAPLGHTGGIAGCISGPICERDGCGKEYGPKDPNNHLHTETLGAKVSTCLTPGYSGDKYCKDCGILLQAGAELQRIDHKWDEGVVIQAPAVGKTGKLKKTCFLCGNSMTQTIRPLDPPKEDTPIVTPPTDPGVVVPETGDVIIETVVDPDQKAELDVETDKKDPAKVTVIYKKTTVVTQKVIVVPDTITVDGKEIPVTEIAKDAFANNPNITNVTLGKNVISIPDEAFKDCTNLKAVKISSKVTVIGNNAFENCKKLSSVNIPDSVKTIGNNAFKNCSNLTKLKVPDKTTKIGSGAFQNCKKLKTVEIGKNVKTIGKNAFAKCPKIKTMKFRGNKVKSVGKNAFKNCIKNVTIQVPKRYYSKYKVLLKGKIPAKARFKKY